MSDTTGRMQRNRTVHIGVNGDDLFLLVAALETHTRHIVARDIPEVNHLRERLLREYNNLMAGSGV